MSNHQARNSRPLIARAINGLSVPIILAWLAVTVLLIIAVPPLEVVASQHAVSLAPTEAPAFAAAKRVNEDFKQSDSGNLAVIVLEGQQPLGDDAHAYYDGLVRQLRNDSTHVLHVQDFWSDELTRAAAESADGKAVYVQSQPRR